MGITGLWDVIGDGDITPLAQLATQYYTEYGRPFHIAIDEAGWRFANLTPSQVHRILESKHALQHHPTSQQQCQPHITAVEEPRANPIEKQILWRITKLLKLNIRLLFVFDGPRRPWKRGGVAGRVDYKKIELLQKLLRHLGIPYHRAPAEAEAECAAIQQAGLVDAVWSEDGDALMFGCSLLLRDYRPGDSKSSAKSDTHVRVYRSRALKENVGIDRTGIVLFALINGCDYTKGIHGCGPTFAAKAARWKGGILGRTLCQTNERSLPVWREQALAFFLEQRMLAVPPGFPHKLAFKHCNIPVVSTPDELNKLRGLRQGWHVEIDQPTFRAFLRQMFNFTTKDYLKHIVPVLLLQSLARRQDSTSPPNVHNVQMVHPRRKQSGDEYLVAYEKKVKFDPVGLVGFNLLEEPPEEDWSSLVTKAEPGFNPIAMLESDVLECILRKTLPAEAFEPSPPATSKAKGEGKRKATDETNVEDPVVPPSKSGKQSAPQSKRPSQPLTPISCMTEPLAPYVPRAHLYEPLGSDLSNRAEPTLVDLPGFDLDSDDEDEDELPDMMDLLCAKSCNPLESSSTTGNKTSNAYQRSTPTHQASVAPAVKKRSPIYRAKADFVDLT